MELHEVEPGKAMPRTHGSSSPHAQKRHQGHAGADGAHGQGRGDPRFHALGGMAADKDKTTVFKLTLSMEGPQKQQIREALMALSDSAALRLIGARLRPERSHRQLPKELQAMIQDVDL